ncbi:MAG: hypothetical protein INR69_22515, partial [Mucilaginibacter polytrichastri]|nr:hypothetical protein [Mucilaginibacter polytrichastri]
MKICIALTGMILSISTFCFAQTPATKLPANDPWTKAQLIAPDVLAKELSAPKTKFVIYNIGAVEDIKSARHIGPAQKAENLEK